jgi:hypothetical protein
MAQAILTKGEMPHVTNACIEFSLYIFFIWYPCKYTRVVYYNSLEKPKRIAVPAFDFPV